MRYLAIFVSLISHTSFFAAHLPPSSPKQSHRNAMFSANENILLRQHKRKVIEFIEATIPENALDMGTTVMVMQVSCRQPGCVPLETAITIVFPKPPKKSKKMAEAQSTDEVSAFPNPLIPGLEESRIGGSFRTRILKPLAEVTNDDVLDALPPEFKGGRRTIESVCLKARDTVFAQIGQLVGNDDTKDSREGRRLVAEYLQRCLGEYVERDCIAPEWGEDFAPAEKVLDQSTAETTDNNEVQDATEKVTMDGKWGKGNIVFRRPVDEPVKASTKEDINDNQPFPEKSVPSIGTQQTDHTTPSCVSSKELLQQMVESRHAPGVRKPGCPCCEPDSAATYSDKMVMF